MVALKLSSSQVSTRGDQLLRNMANYLPLMCWTVL